MSLTEFRLAMFEIFASMKEHNLTIEISHRRKIYRLYVEDTGRKVETPYNIKKQRKSTPVLSHLIESSPCPECRSLLVNGICMNAQCTNGA